MKSIENVTLAQIMSESTEFWVTKSKKFGYQMTIEDENGEEILNEDMIHPCAMEELARFCSLFMMNYNRLEKQ